MKKGLTFTGVLALFFGLFAYAIQPTFATDSTKDQSNDSEIGGASLTLFTSSTTRAQTFSPKMNRLTQVDIYLTNRVSGAWVEVALIDEESQEMLDTGGTRMGSGNGWESIGIGSSLEINTSKVYRIKVYNDESLGVGWTYTGDNYDGGVRWYGSTSSDPSGDMNFRTWGYDIESPSEESDIDNDNDVLEESVINETTDSTQSEALGTTTSSISKPTNLTAEYQELENKKGVSLNWKASATSDIDGYKIFRSTDKNKNYLKMAQIESDILTYLDENIVASTTYYYIVRAYKYDQQSYNSNIAQVDIPEDIGPNKPQSLRILDVGKDLIEVAWTKTEEENLAGYVLTITNNDNLVESTELSQEENRYRFENLKENETYTVTLVAKNKAGKISPPASIVQQTLSGENPSFAITTTVILLGLGGVGLIFLLILLILRRKRQQKA